MCGEKPVLRFSGLFPAGSPPRVRGKAFQIPVFFRSARITPACAGKSGLHHLIDVDRQDHPRVCGEKNLTLNYEDMQKGSPPRVRGKAFVAPHVYMHEGITPACAGKRLSGRPPTAELWDHPRVCGEKG